MLETLLPISMIDSIKSVVELSAISEIRLRLSRPVRYQVDGVFYTLNDGNTDIIATLDDIRYILSKATRRSMYAYNEQIAKGYISYSGGIRIGVAGDGVETDGCVTTFSSITYLAIRIPSEIKGVSQCIVDRLTDFKSNIVIISPPSKGKTTLLRDYVREVSNRGYNVLLIDERNEIAASNMGKATLDVGPNTDVLSGISKVEAYKMGIRALNPDILATDEVFGDREIDSLLDAIRTGVNVVLTIHAKDAKALSGTSYQRLLDVADVIVTIDKDRKYIVEHV